MENKLIPIYKDSDWVFSLNVEDVNGEIIDFSDTENIKSAYIEVFTEDTLPEYVSRKSLSDFKRDNILVVQDSELKNFEPGLIFIKIKAKIKSDLSEDGFLDISKTIQSSTYLNGEPEIHQTDKEEELRGIIENLNLEIIEKSDKISSLGSEIQEKADKILELKREVLGKEELLVELQIKVDTIDEVLGEKDSRIQALTDYIKVQEEDIKRLNSEIEPLENEISRLNLEVENLQSEIQEKEDTYNDLLGEYRTLLASDNAKAEEIVQLKTQMKALGTQVSELQENINSLSSEISDLQEQISGLNNDLASRDLEIINLQDTLAEKTEEIENLENQVSELSEKAEENDTYTPLIKQALQEKEALISSSSLSTVPEEIKSIGGLNITPWEPNPQWWDIKSLAEQDFQSDQSKATLYVLCTDAYGSRIMVEGIPDIFTFTTSTGLEISVNTWVEIGGNGLKPVYNDSGDLLYNTFWIKFSWDVEAEDEYYLLSKNSDFNLTRIINDSPEVWNEWGWQEGFLNRQSSVLYAVFTNTAVNLICLSSNNCRSLESIEIYPKTDYSGGPDGVIPGSSGDCKFANCISLKKIPTLSYNDCDNMESVFQNCQSIEKVSLKGTLKNRYSETVNWNTTFDNCKNLKIIDLSGITNFDPSGDKIISGTFRGCISLGYDQIKPLVENLKLKTLVSAFERCWGITELDFKGEVDLASGWGGYAFGYCKNLKKVKFSNPIGLTGENNIGDRQNYFYNCTNLEEVIFGDGSQEYIFKPSYFPSFFFNCVNLTSVKGVIFDCSETDDCCLDGERPNNKYPLNIKISGIHSDKDFSGTRLSKSSIEYIINNVLETGENYTITFHTNYEIPESVIASALVKGCSVGINRDLPPIKIFDTSELF